MERKNGIRYCTTKSARVIQVIETRSIRGAGTNEDPVRDLTQYWDFDGHLLAEFDPCAESGWENAISFEKEEDGPH